MVARLRRFNDEWDSIELKVDEPPISSGVLMREEFTLRRAFAQQKRHSPYLTEPNRSPRIGFSFSKI